MFFEPKMSSLVTIRCPACWASSVACPKFMGSLLKRRREIHLDIIYYSINRLMGRMRGNLDNGSHFSIVRNRIPSISKSLNLSISLIYLKMAMRSVRFGCFSCILLHIHKLQLQ
jgi:hypothetical protein